MLAAALVAVGGAVAGVVLAWPSDNAHLGAVVEPGGYHVVYRITSPGAGARQEARDVRRPYDGRTMTSDANGQPIQGSLTNEQGSFLLEQGKWDKVTDGLHRAAGDESAVPALRAAVSHRLARVTGYSTVLGRRCTVVRTRNPAGATVAAPTKSDHTDLCLDQRTGVILREAWTLKGKLAQLRVAIDFTTTPPSANLFAAAPGGPDLGVEYAGQPGVPHDTPLPIDKIPPLPVRVTPTGGYQLNGALLENVVSPNGDPLSTIVQHFVNGSGDLVDVKIGDASATGTSYPVSLPGGRTGHVTYDLTASQLVLSVAGRNVLLEGTDPQLLIRASAWVQPTG